MELKIYKVKRATQSTMGEIVVSQCHYTNIDTAINDFESYRNNPHTYGVYLLELSDDGYGRLAEVREMRQHGSQF